MAYTKPAIIAQNSSAGSYAAGCPAQDRGIDTSGNCTRSCANCDRAQ